MGEADFYPVPEERPSKVAGALSLFSTCELRFYQGKHAQTCTDVLARQSELRREALAGVIDATRDDANPLTEAEAKLYDFV